MASEVEVVVEGVYLGVSGEKVNDMGDSVTGVGIGTGVGSVVSMACSIVSVATAAVFVVLVIS